MGVKELTSYIESLEPPISLQVQAQVTLGVPDLRSSSIPPTETLVIDGWVWLFFHYLRNFPNTVDGGDYLLFDQEINEVFMFGGKFPLLSVLIQVLIANTHLLGASAYTSSSYSTVQQNPKSFQRFLQEEKIIVQEMKKRSG